MGAALLVAGCSGSKPRPVGPYRPAGPPQNAVQREIDAAAGLPFERDRRELLEAVAVRSVLGPVDQVRLIDAAIDRLPSDEDLQIVLLALAGNPALTQVAVLHIQARRDDITHPHVRIRVMQAIGGGEPEF
ncbi:MAG: hypothetical protein ACR2N5_01785 [Solirubrobacterales bacterium]